MQEKNLLKLALATSITGICMLLLISLYSEKEEIPFQLNEEDNAVISGKISMISHSKNVTFMRIIQNTPVKAVIFEDYSGLNEGDFVKARGKIEKYKGDKELIIEEIRKI